MITYSINVMKDGEEIAYITNQSVYGLSGNMLHSFGNLIYHKVIIDGVDMDCDYLMIRIYYDKTIIKDIDFIVAKKTKNIFYGMIVNPINYKELFFLKKIIKNGIVESFHSSISYKERLSYISAIGHYRRIKQEHKNFEKELIIDADVCDWPSFLLNICHKCNFDSCITVGSAYAFMDFINDNSILWEYTNLLKFKFLDNNLRSIKKSYIDYYQENHQESCIYSLIFSSIISNYRLNEIYKSIYGGDYELDEYDFPNKNYLKFEIKTLNDVFLAIGSGRIKTIPNLHQ
ncbi:hypothetical protein [Bartonella sp. HY761]|uniref:hypothetical protein n=1 Tax=Bartonella sp. HY761 TaxID=2979330 RepID=UPI0021FD5CB5|nr:hypothetical protein [Bartonella sp. HY761]UXN06808.1 hypothetical protein N6A79_02005 [Bartonella sp. HY761]